MNLGEPDLLWTFMEWDDTFSCYRQAGFFFTKEAACSAHRDSNRNWGGPSPIYSVRAPWLAKNPLRSNDESTC